jgi:hypothetical protein
MNLIKKAIPVLIAVLLVSMLIGCGGTTSVDEVVAIELVPQRADTVGHMALGQILSDSELTDLYDRLPKDPDEPQTFEEAIDTAIDETGMDPRDFDEIFFFADTSAGTGDSNYYGVIVKGSFNEDTIIDAIEKQTEVELSSLNYNGYDLYIDETEMTALAFFADDTLIIGTLEAVEDVIDVKNGDEAAFSGDVLSRYNGIGDVLVKLAASIAPEMTENLVNEAGESMPVELDLSSVTDAETATITLMRDGQSLDLDIEICFASRSSANAFKGLITLATAMIEMLEFPEEGPRGVPIPEGSQDALPKILSELDTEVTDSCLNIELNLTFDEIEDLASEQNGS